MCEIEYEGGREGSYLSRTGQDDLVDSFNHIKIFRPLSTSSIHFVNERTLFKIVGGCLSVYIYVSGGCPTLLEFLTSMIARRATSIMAKVTP